MVLFLHKIICGKLIRVHLINNITMLFILINVRCDNMPSLERVISTGFIIILSLLLGIYIGISYARSKSNKENKSLRDETLNNSVDIDIRGYIIDQMETLKNTINADFIGLAIYDAMTEEIRWRLAVGATNSRYKRIVIRMGKGIAGEVIQLNRTVKIESFPNDVLGKPIEYPILLVEHIKSSIAVPVADSLRIYGVLLVGQRNERQFTEAEEMEINNIAQDIAQEIASANFYTRVVNETKSTTNKSNKEYINDSIFINYLDVQKVLLREGNRGELEFEVLDQSIVEIPNNIQQLLIDNTDEILTIANESSTDKSVVSIVRDESNLLVEIKINRSIENTKDRFKNIYNNIGEIGGSIVSYHEEDKLYFIMQLPVWSYKNPFI